MSEKMIRISKTLHRQLKVLCSKYDFKLQDLTPALLNASLEDKEFLTKVLTKLINDPVKAKELLKNAKT